MLKRLMQTLGEDNVGGADRRVFEERTRLLRQNIGPDLYDRIIDMSIDQDGKVNCGMMGRIVDLYKYAPGLTKKFKNTSEQFQQLALFGTTMDDNTTTYKNYKLLAQKIEEKFDQMRKAYRFFDIEKVHNVFSFIYI